MLEGMLFTLLNFISDDGYVEFKGDRARTDDSSEDVQNDWKSVPSCGTRHSSVDSNSSMFSLFDYQVEFMAIADRSMPKDTPATTPEPSSHHLDAFSNSATFSEIRLLFMFHWQCHYDNIELTFIL